MGIIHTGGLAKGAGGVTISVEASGYKRYSMDTDPSVNSNIRFNCQDYTVASGDIIGIVTKPAASVDGTASVRGIESSPRFQDGIGGNSITGIFAGSDLKGSSGDLTGNMRAYEGKIEGGSGRTIAGVASILEANQALKATVTGGAYVIYATAAGDTTAWDGFANLPNDSQLANNNDSKAGGQVGWIKVKIGTLTGYIQVETLA